jgi:hypothetical protein
VRSICCTAGHACERLIPNKRCGQCGISHQQCRKFRGPGESFDSTGCDVTSTGGRESAEHGRTGSSC